MFMLAMRSIGQRPGRFLATLLAAFLGAGIIMTFNSLYDTAGRPGVDPVGSAPPTTPARGVGGQALLDSSQDSGQVAGSVDHSCGPVALLSGVDITLVAAAGAAFLAVRRATRTRRPRGRGRAVLAHAALGLRG